MCYYCPYLSSPHLTNCALICWYLPTFTKISHIDWYLPTVHVFTLTNLAHVFKFAYICLHLPKFPHIFPTFFDIFHICPNFYTRSNFITFTHISPKLQNLPTYADICQHFDISPIWSHFIFEIDQKSENDSISKLKWNFYLQWSTLTFVDIQVSKLRSCTWNDKKAPTFWVT
jgi:hypothetical protein